MDGARARRQKAGSPFGRLLDEANDMIQMTMYQVALAYLLRVNNPILEILFICLNVIFFMQEAKYLLCKELILNVGEIGSIEIEHLFSAMFILASYYGSSVYDMTLGETFNFSLGTGLISGLKWKIVIATLLSVV
ncbi:MAG: CDP-alcohol phosphatidyltransferase family protein [bacterium]|jgi:phosphatidylglycerophosphate synthase